MVPQNRRKKIGVTGNRAMDISILLERVLDKHHISEDMHFKVISEHFEDIVGTVIKDHVSLVKIEKHTLVLKTDSSAWKSELFLQKKAIIDKCNSVLGKPFIQTLKFV